MATKKVNIVNIFADAEVGMTCIAARSAYSMGVDTTGELLHLMDDVVESYFSPCVRVWPIPAVPCRLAGHSYLKRNIGLTRSLGVLQAPTILGCGPSGLLDNVLHAQAVDVING